MDSTGFRLNEAIRLIKAGQKEAGKNILTNLLTLHPNLEVAWLWLADCAENRERKIYCLQKAFEINPQRPQLRKVLDELLDSVETTPKSLAPELKPIPPPEAHYLLSHNASPARKKKLASAVASPIPAKPQTPPKKSSPASPISRLTAKSQPSQPKKKSRSISLHKDLAAENVHKVLGRKSRAEERWAPGDEAANKRTLDAVKEDDQTDTPEDDVKAESHEGQMDTKGERSAIPFRPQPPTVIVVNRNDNIYADQNWNIGKLSIWIDDRPGYQFIIDGVRINSTHFPRCLRLGYIPDDGRCSDCDFFTPFDCIFLDYPDLIGEIGILLEGARQRYNQYRIHKKSALRAIYHELKAHGRPLHYSTLARIVTARHPQLNLTEKGVLRIMSNHQDIFENVSEGVYKYRRQRKM